MNIATNLGSIKMIFFWSTAVAMALAVAMQANPNATFVSQGIFPYGVYITDFQGGNDVDPRKAITLEAVGVGVRLSRVELVNDKGNILFIAKDKTRLSLPAPLAFGTRQTIKVTAEQAWLGQSETYEVDFTTVSMPKLEGSSLRMLEPDASVTLHFDHPVDGVQTTGDLALRAEADATGQNIRLLASAYAQDHS